MTTRWPEQRERTIAVACLLVYAGVASLTQPLTVLAAIAVAVPAMAVVAITLVRRAPRPADSDRLPVRRSGAVWAILLALAAGWEIAVWQQQPSYNVASYDHPTLSVLLDPLTAPPLARFVVWCCWLYIGYRLVRR